MSAFSLAGLLRLRHLEQESAGEELARANANVRDNEHNQRRSRRALAGFGDAATSVETLRAIASARASSTVMLSELIAVAEIRASDAAAAQAAYSEARRTAAGLEKLETRHNERVVNEELHAEQIVLDEIASAAWYRNGGGNE